MVMLSPPPEPFQFVKFFLFATVSPHRGHNGEGSNHPEQDQAGRDHDAPPALTDSPTSERSVAAIFSPLLAKN